MVSAKKFKIINQDIIRQVQPTITKEQNMLQQLFAGERTFGTGKNLPVIDQAITSGEGIIKNGDNERRTASFFGLKFRRF